MSDKFEGHFLESADLMASRPVTLTISGIVPPNTEKAADGRLIDKPIIAFEKTDKRMIIGKTNERIIKSFLGSKPNEWVGQKVTVMVRYLKAAFGESNVPTLRIVPPEGKPIPFACRKHWGQEMPFGAPSTHGDK